MITDTTGIFKTKDLPELKLGQARYVMAASGLYYEQHDELFHASTSIHEFYREVNFGSMNLLSHAEFFLPKFPMIPENLLAQCLGFFQAVEEQQDCECGLVLLYDPDTRTYQWCCPQQQIGRADLHFTTPIPGQDYPEHLMHFGDIHLHPGMAAYHSWTDKDDEMTASDGLHLVVGTPIEYGEWDSKSGKYKSKKKKVTEFCAVFVSEGARFKVEPKMVLKSTSCQPGEFPEEWLDKCQKYKNKTFWGYGGYDSRDTDDRGTKEGSSYTPGSSSNLGGREVSKESKEGGWKYGYGSDLD